MDRKSAAETVGTIGDGYQYHVEFHDGDLAGALTEAHARSIVLASYPVAISVEHWQAYRRAFVGERPENGCYLGAEMLLFWCQDPLLPEPEFDDADRRLAELLSVAKIARSKPVLSGSAYEVVFRFCGTGNPPWGISLVEQVPVRAADEPAAVRIASEQLAERLRQASSDRPLDQMYVPVCVAHGDANAIHWQLRRLWSCP